MIPEGYGEARLMFSGPACPNGAMTTFGFDTSENEASIQETAFFFFDFFRQTILDYCVAGVVLVGCEVKYGPDETGPSATHTGNAPGTGGSAETFANSAWLLHKQTSFGGRAGRGRNYVPGIGENQVSSSGVIVPLHLSGMASECETFRSQCALTNRDLVVLHGPGSPLTAPTPVTSLVPDSRIATQRRRLRR